MLPLIAIPAITLGEGAAATGATVLGVLGIRKGIKIFRGTPMNNALKAIKKNPAKTVGIVLLGTAAVYGVKRFVQAYTAKAKAAAEAAAETETVATEA
jgi:hypothetical protein